MKKPLRYKVGQKLFVPFIVTAVDADDPETTYFIQIDENAEIAPEVFDDWCGWVNEESLTDAIEFCDPDIRKQKIAAKIASLQQEYNSI